MKKTAALLICAAMIMALLPLGVLGAVTVSGSGTNFFANGIPVTIQAAAPVSGNQYVPVGFTATGTSAYIVWNVGSTTYYCGVGSNTVVYGGSDGSVTPVTVDSTSVSMTGGSIFRIYGGNLGQDSTNPSATNPLTAASTVTGDVKISVTGGSGLDVICGGGKLNAAVNGKVTIDVIGVSTLGDGCYIMGGVHGNGHEGYIDVDNQNVITNANVTSVEINYVNSKSITWDMVSGGGGGNTSVGSAKIVLGDGTGTDDTVADYVYTSGINGAVGATEMTLNSDVSVPGELAAVNRGYVSEGTIEIDGANIETVYTGATNGCFGSDSPTNGGASTVGGMTFKVTDASGINNFVISPNINATGGTVTSKTGNLTITNTDTVNPLNVTTATFDPGNALSDINTFSNDEDDTLLIGENVQLTVSTDNKLENVGSLVINGKLTADGPVEIKGTGELLNNGEIENNSELRIEDNAAVTNAGTISNTEGSVMAIVGEGQLLNAAGSEITGENPSFDGGVMKYYATISGGTGSGYYEEGETVNAAFDDANKTLIFGGWTIPADLVLTEGAADKEAIAFEMPASSVTVTAKSTSKVPPTGDSVFTVIALLAVSAVAIAVIAKRKEA